MREPDEIQIHIGRIEVTAVHPAPAPAAAKTHTQCPIPGRVLETPRQEVALSSALGISAVTAVLQYLFTQIYNASGLGTVSITAVAPDVAQANLGTDSGTQLQVNLFLHQVTLNPALRNFGLPVLAADGSTQLTNPPVALDLHYLLTAYASYDTGAEALLGYGVQFLIQNPVLTRAQINAAFLPHESAALKQEPTG